MITETFLAAANGLFGHGTTGVRQEDPVAGAFRVRVRGIHVWLGLTLAAAPAMAADVLNGAKIYARHCAACHGPAGMSVMPGAPNLARGERLLQPDQALLAALKAGKNAMPAFVGVLADREILDVLAYTRSLRR